ncbi:MAG: hypothetical protein HY716_06835 [Planctomycetes bacterium]|nr:hypothetical protein [Planctomycetota bacterium]
MNLPNDAKQLLDQVHPSGRGFVLAVITDRLISRFVSDSGDVERILGELTEIQERECGIGVYYSLAAYDNVPEKRGAEHEVSRVQCCFADIDKPDKASALCRINAFSERTGCGPSILVDSGAGYQCLWLLQEPVEVGPFERGMPTPEALGVRAINAALARELDGDPTIDLARIFRLPGTLNTKCFDPKYQAKGYAEPLPCRIVAKQLDRRYSLEEFDRIVRDDDRSRAARIVPIQTQANRSPAAPVDLDDQTLLDLARSAANGHKFTGLWNGEIAGYPSHSEADQALCCHLAFWTRKDAARIDRLFRLSGLYRPKKWDLETYRDRTIAKAIQFTAEEYTPASQAKQDKLESPQDGPDIALEVEGTPPGQPPEPPDGGDDGLPDEEPPSERRTQAGILVALADDADAFHTPEARGYVSVPVGKHRETYPIRSKSFRLWLQRRFYQAQGKPPSNQAVTDALDQIEAKAIFEGPEEPVHVRIGEARGNIYLDLGDPEWNAVEITPSGWRVIKNPPVRFRRPKSLMALPQPVAGGSVGELRAFINVPDESSWVLMVAWLVGAFFATGPYPILILIGEQGSAKSMAARFLRWIIDPSIAPLRTMPRDERDLLISAVNGWALVFDNLSSLSPWISDALCRLATGGGLGTRELYTDLEEILLDVRRPVILNGIENVASRDDLRERSIIVTLPAIPPEERRDETAMLAEFDKARAAILGAVLDAVSVALRRRREIKLKRLPRMADFALRVTAAEPALGWTEGTFMAAYEEHESNASSEAVAFDPFAQFILGRAERGWFGTAGQLLKELREEDSEGGFKNGIFPNTPRKLADRLRRIAPNLRKTGWQFTCKPEGHKRERIIRFSPKVSTSSASSAPSAIVRTDESNDAKPEPNADEADEGFLSRAKPTPLAPSAVNTGSKPARCYIHPNTPMWLSVHGARNCTLCHPPADASLVREYLQ